MAFRLRISRIDPANGHDHTLRGNFRFAVIDFNRSKSYPLNFVCMLPLNAGKIGNNFEQVFGDQSLDEAKMLLKESLKREDDFEVRAEIDRRLKLLDPNQAKRITCGVCRTPFFTTHRIRKFKQNLCETCFKKRYGVR